MPSPRKKLPIGIQNFREIREGGYYYVDKTPFACRLFDEGKYYFLSRPRRFGKSLFVDTLKELFEGNQGLFDGLYAETHWDWSVKRPVLRFSFGEGVKESHTHLDAEIQLQLQHLAKRLDVTTESQELGRFSLRALVRAAHEKYRQRVVILVDEYDKPILDYIENTELAEQMRDTLSLFYSAIKELDPHLEFVLLTGVSKFSKVNLFSKLNNLEDITLDARHSAICGYTEADVDTVFAPELPGLDREGIRQWYNGYNWTGEAVYNPFDLLLLFQKRELRPFWYETGTPTFLVKLLAERRTFLPKLDKLYAGHELLGQFDVDFIASEALLFQTGYLTLGSIERRLGETFYTLTYPNREVRSSLNNTLLRAWTETAPDTPQTRFRLLDALEKNDLTGLHELVDGFYASIPHQWYTNNPIAQYEGYYASVFYALFASLGLDIRVEESSNAGRLDMAIRIDNRAILFEFKLVADEAESTALAQILTKGYAEPYRAAGNGVTCIGIEFSKTTRRIVAWDVEADEGR